MAINNQINKIDNKQIDKCPEVVYSKVKIMRNFRNLSFVNLLEQSERKKMEFSLIEFMEKSSYNILCYDLNRIEENDKLIFIEKGLVDKNSLVSEEGKILYIADKNVVIQLNHQDHINFVIVKEGLSFNDAYNLVENMEDVIGKNFPYTVSSKYGFLTQNLMDCGLGLKLSVLMHLPGIQLTKKTKAVFKLFRERGYLIKPWIYQKDDKTPAFFILTSDLNYGLSEQKLIDRFIEGISSLSEINLESLIEFKNKNRIELFDTIYRSYGLLKHAYKISYLEALEHISNLKLGLELKLNLPIDNKIVNKLFMQIKEGHVNKYSELSKTSKNIARSEMIKKTLN